MYLIEIVSIPLDKSYKHSVSSLENCKTLTFTPQNKKKKMIFIIVNTYHIFSWNHSKYKLGKPQKKYHLLTGFPRYHYSIMPPHHCLLFIESQAKYSQSIRNCHVTIEYMPRWRFGTLTRRDMIVLTLSEKRKKF